MLVQVNGVDGGCTLFVLILVLLGDTVFHRRKILIQLNSCYNSRDCHQKAINHFIKQRISESEEKALNTINPSEVHQGLIFCHLCGRRRRMLKVSVPIHPSSSVGRPCLDSRSNIKRSGNRLMVCLLLWRPFARQSREREIDAHQD